MFFLIVKLLFSFENLFIDIINNFITFQVMNQNYYTYTRKM